MTYGQLINQTRNQALRNVVRADRVLELPVVVVPPLAVPDRPALVLGSVVQGLRPLVSGDHGQPAFELLGEPDAQGVEVCPGPRQRARGFDVSVLRERQQERARLNGRVLREVARLEEVVEWVRDLRQ